MARRGKSINDIGYQLERIRSARSRDITDAYDRRIARRVERAEDIGRRYFNNIENKKGTSLVWILTRSSPVPPIWVQKQKV